MQLQLTGPVRQRYSLAPALAVTVLLLGTQCGAQSTSGPSATPSRPASTRNRSGTPSAASVTYATAVTAAPGSRNSAGTWLPDVPSGCPATPVGRSANAGTEKATTPPPAPLASELGTVGVLDDNSDLAAYRSYWTRLSSELPDLAGPDPNNRITVKAVDASGRPLLDVSVSPNDNRSVVLRTGPDGRVALLPRLFTPAIGTSARIVLRKGRVSTTAKTTAGEKTVTLAVTRPRGPTKADIAFVLDSTSSNGYMPSITNQLVLGIQRAASIGTAPDVRFALTLYRDCGDDYVVRQHDFTPDATAIADAVGSLSSSGGADRPEQLGLALRDTVSRLAWRGDDTLRIVFIVTDAPPQLGDSDASKGALWSAAIGASAAGIRLHTVLMPASDVDVAFTMRQLAELTNGKVLSIAEPGGTPLGASLGTPSLAQGVLRLVSEDLAWQSASGRPLPPL